MSHISMNATPTRSADPADKDFDAQLPAKAAARFQNLRDAADDAGSVARSIGAELVKLNEREMLAEVRLRELTYGADETGVQRVGEGHPEMRRVQSKLSKVRRERARAGSRYAAMGERSQNLLRAVAAIHAWVAKLPASALITDHPIQLNGSKTGSADVSALRQRLSDLRAERDMVSAAALTCAEARALAHAEIEALSERGRPGVAHLLEVGHPIAWRQNRVSLQVLGGNDSQARFAAGNVGDAIALVAWLFKPQLRAAVDALIDASADGAGTLDAAARATKITQIETEILDIERQECAIIDRLGNFDYRGDTDPRAILGIAARER